MSENLTKRCKQCGLSKPKAKFSKNSEQNDGIDVFCNDCRKKLVIDEESLKTYCYESGRGWNQNLFKEALIACEDRLKKQNKDKSIDNFDELLLKKTINYYFSKMNLPQNIDGSKQAKITKSTSKLSTKKKPKSDFNITEEVLMRWGYGLEIDAYEYMENIYQSFIGVYSSDTPVQRMIYEDIAKTRYEAEKARKGGNVTLYEKLVKIVSTLMNDGNIKPVQATAADNEGLGTWGQWVKKIEEEEPIPKPSKEFLDVDGISKYINKWFVNHFSRILGVENNTIK